MKLTSYLLVSVGVFISGILSTTAASDWFSFSSNNDVTPVYCQNKDECTLANGVTATEKAVNGQVTNKPLSQYIQQVVAYFLTFISLVAVIYIIYGGFVLMIGAGDEEKMKKMKNIILYVVLGIIVMWGAYAIVNWAIKLVSPVAWSEQKPSISWSIVPEVSAYTESDADTFRDYQGRIKVAIENLEAELRVNGKVAVSSIQGVKSLVQSAYDRLPDTGEFGTTNSTAKRAVDMYLDIAIKNPSSTQKVGDAISKTSAFLDGAKISTVAGSITATPSEGNAPLTVSFLANDVVDPSGTTPASNNYIWWVRENGNVRREIGRGASLVYTFTQEGTFAVNLDVISGSRNSKGKIDVLPLSLSQSISVKPKLGEIVLLINGVNVSNLDSIKINPTLGKMGIILDATASRAIGNGSITKTVWKFGNGNEMNYSGKPIVERQIYGTQGAYTLELSLETNDGKKINKKLQLIVRDPSAVIQIDDEVGHVGEPLHFSALSYFTTTSNVEYSWQIQDDNNKKVLKSAAGKTLDYTFDTVGKYIVTLNAKSPNGNIDSDSRTIVIESKEPIVNLEAPVPVSKERPNTFVFNAVKSYDPDTKSSKGLTYSWRLDGEKVELNNVTDNGARGTITFDAVGTHTISLTVANAFGKVSTTEKTFTIDSTLAVDMIITPQVAPIGTSMTFIARSENADFYEWNFGDGTPVVSGGEKLVQHVFKKTGNYNVSLTVSSKQGGKTNQTQKKVYITDTNNPFAIIGVSNGSNTTYEDPTACSSGAMVINRSEATTLNGSKSVNIDGSANDLTYTWSYFGKTKTTPTLSEKFGELGCFPVKLTVRSNKNGATSTTTQYLYLKNQAPEITSISTNIDTTKKDSQKVLVKVTANGAVDRDGVITSYIWYYTTESDKEPQNVQITQKPEITFVLPNITEKYYFGVILEDNDGARVNSMDDASEQTPLILSNQNGNIYLPLITLSTPKTAVVAGENVHLSVEAKTIVGTNITNKSEYAWDFDGDGKIDQKTQSPSVDHIYENAGTYSTKVRVTYNGVSNSKYQTIYVKNELKAHAHGYRLKDGSYYILNSSEGIYDKALWAYRGGSVESLYSVIMEPNTQVENGVLGTLSISNRESDINTADIKISDIEDISSMSGLLYQSSPKAESDTIHIKSSAEKILLSMIGNSATRYAVDTDITIDSDLDGIPDNDADNKDLPSHNDGSVFVMKDFTSSRGREQKMKITLFQGNTPITSKTITLVFDYIPEGATGSGEELASIGSGAMSDFDRAKLDELASLVRSTDDINRIVLMKAYNTLVENWDDTFAKSKNLIDIQTIVDSSSLGTDKKTGLTTVINDLLSGESQATDDITLAARLINGLVSKSPNAATLSEKLTAIEFHPQSFEANTALAKEVFDIVQADSSLDTDTKKYIYNQLSVIKSGGTQNVAPETIETPSSGSSSGILGFIGGIVKVFFLIIGIILLVILVGYGFYRVSRKNTDIGFQDFLIDSVFHARKTTNISSENITTTTTSAPPVSPTITPVPSEGIKPSIVSTDVLVTQEKEIAPIVDPMTTFDEESPASPPPVPKIPVSSPDSILIGTATPANAETPAPTVPPTPEIKVDILGSAEPQTSEGSASIAPIADNSSPSGIPDWLKMPEEVAEEKTEDVQEPQEPAPVMATEADIPDWLKGNSTTPVEETPTTETTKEEVSAPAVEEVAEEKILPEEKSTTPDGNIPDWLVDSIKEESTTGAETIKEEKKKKEPSKKKAPKNETKDVQAKSVDTGAATADIPDWLK